MDSDDMLERFEDRSKPPWDPARYFRYDTERIVACLQEAVRTQYFFFEESAALSYGYESMARILLEALGRVVTTVEEERPSEEYDRLVELINHFTEQVLGVRDDPPPPHFIYVIDLEAARERYRLIQPSTYEDNPNEDESQDSRW